MSETVAPAQTTSAADENMHLALTVATARTNAPPRVGDASGRAMLMRDMIERSRAESDARRKASVLKQAALRRLGADDSADVTMLVVPANRVELVAVTEERRRRLRRHIAALLRADEVRPDLNAAGRASPAAETSSVTDQACAACQGKCCGWGAERAYLTTATMARVAGSPDRPSAGRILRRYVQHIPREAVRNSCIFHGAHGCTLDRSLRSDVCNRHYCAPLLDWFRVQRATQPREVLVMAVADGVLHEARLVTAETES